MNHPEVSVIIVNYNTEKLLEDCIDSITKRTQYIDYEIIVVDNNSNSGLLPRLLNIFPNVKFEILDKNIGFGAANNAGAKIAKGKYLLFLNPDTLLINNAIQILYRYIENHIDTAICGGNMYKGDMTSASSYYDTNFLLDEYKVIFDLKRELGFNYTELPKEVNVIVGADLLIRKNVFDQAGGFDEDFFMYFEEVELCRRVQKAGYKIVSVPDAKIIHLQGKSAENKNEELKKWSYKEHWYSKYIYFHKVNGKMQVKILHSVHVLKFGLAVIFYKMKKNKDKLDYWFTKKELMDKAYSGYDAYLKNKSNSF